MSEDIKRIYEQDIREKKQIGRGARSRTGKQGHVGKMRTPADLLTGKEKKAYTQSSTISTSNLYDQIMPLEDFKSLSKQKKMLVLDAYRRRFTTKEIAAQWSLSDKTLYYYYRAYGVTRGKPSKDKEPHGSAQFAEEAAADKTTANDDNGNGGSGSDSAHAESECSFTAVGEFGAESLCRKLQGLSFMLNDELRYLVEIRVREIPSHA